MHKDTLSLSLWEIKVRKGTSSLVNKVMKPKKGKGSFKRKMKNFSLD